MRSLFKRSNPLPPSKLFDENTFYKALLLDLNLCTSEAVIESPFITSNRIQVLLPTLHKMTRRGVSVTVNTRHPKEHGPPFDRHATEAIEILQTIGVTILFTGGHHRKLAIFDRKILWEGSLNILSQNTSCEIMRRIESKEMAQQMINFVKLEQFLK